VNIVPTPPPASQDALEVLRWDHQRIGALFADYAQLAGNTTTAGADRSGLLARIGAVLSAHHQIEVELFYPQLEAPEFSIQEAVDDHAQLAMQLQALAASDVQSPDFDERMAELALQVTEHMAREERLLFPRALSLDLQTLGTALSLRRAQLMGDQGID
jgi:iron-sulfur cluster repair protein YtfE (RIC family)